MHNQKRRVSIVSFLICLATVLSMVSSLAVVSYAEDNPDTILKSKVIVSMGDSFSSGEGIPEFYDQNMLPHNKVHSQDWLAHRSTRSWPGRLTLPAVTDGNGRVAMSDRRDTNWYFVATSGATTADIKGRQKKHYDYGGENLVGNLDGVEYIDPQINVFDKLGNKKVDYITLTIGGNDVDFTGVVTTAVIPHPFNRNAIEDKINNLKKEFNAQNGIKEKITQAYKDIYERAKKNNPKVKIIVAGYPKLISEKGSGVLFSEYDAKTINSGVVWFNGQLEKIIQSLKDEGMRICFVPVVDAFSGKEAYASTKGEEFINRLGHITSQDIDQSPAVPTTAYSIHPNDRGAAAYAECVQNKINQIEKDGGASEWPMLGSSEERDAVLVLDASGSMEGTPLNETKKAATNFVETVLFEEAAVGVVTYDSDARLISDFNQNYLYMKGIIEDIRTGGTTNIEAGLIEAEKLFEESIAKKKFIVLMSDGQPNEGKEGDDLINYANTLKGRGIKIYTLGFFGDMSDKTEAQSLMERIASEGCHFEVDNAEHLKFFFEDIAEQIRGTKYQYIRIACPVDVKVSYGGETLSSKDATETQRTSFGTLTFEENPEPSKNGNDNRIKVLRLKEGASYDVKIKGNGSGKMDYTIGFMDENGEYSDMRRFSNIKITKKTEIDTVAANTSSTSLKVDEDGDGKYDIIYKADKNGKGKKVDYMPTFWALLTPVFVLLFIIVVMIVVAIVKRKMKKTA